MRITELFTPPYSDEPRTLTRQTQTSDIINLHWVPYLLDWKHFFNHLSPKQHVIWTFHDQNPLTGSLHYLEDQDQVGKAPIDPYEREIWEHILGLQPILNRQTTIVTPSRWLTNLATNHPFWHDSECVTIHNGVDLTLFNTDGERTVRDRYGISPDTFMMLFVADKVEQRRKGCDLLIQVLNKLGSTGNWHSVSVGSGDSPFTHSNHTHIGSVTNESSMAEIYRSADLLIVPSRIDNLPNTAVEAASCGTPSIAFEQGGMSDVIGPKHGILITPYDTESMAGEIASLIENPTRLAELSRNSRLKAEADFDIRKQATKYLRLFEECSQRNRTSAPPK
ncbi:MAG: glycosyltransferase [Opitutales bacterium]|nr:glycosyltransferase [Opitutales bacterium]